MPEESYRIQTGGSARSREIDTINDEVDVSGVPGHTHNATAIASISSDFKQLRGTATTVNTDWAHPALVLAAEDVVDTDIIEDEVTTFDRAIEKGIGKIRLIPENCHHDITEPTRAISEIRTIVTAKDQLESLTYIEERGGWVVPTTDEAGVGTDFCDVYIDLLGPGRVYGLAEVPVDRQSSCNITADTHRYLIKIANDNAIGTKLSDGSRWDGRIRLEWNPTDRRYQSEAFRVTLDAVRHIVMDAANAVANGVFPRVIHPNPANNNEDVMDAADLTGAGAIVITFPAILTTPALDGFCLVTSRPSDCLEKLTHQNAETYTPAFQVAMHTATGVLGPFAWNGPSAYRIPVGGTTAVPAPIAPYEAVGAGHNLLREILSTQHDSMASLWDDQYHNYVGAHANLFAPVGGVTGGPTWIAPGIEWQFGFGLNGALFNWETKIPTYDRTSSKGHFWYPHNEAMQPRGRIKDINTTLAHYGITAVNFGQGIGEALYVMGDAAGANNWNAANWGLAVVDINLVHLALPVVGNPYMRPTIAVAPAGFVAGTSQQNWEHFYTYQPDLANLPWFAPV